MVTSPIEKALRKAIVSLGFTSIDIHLEHPAEETHGDYSTNIALKLFQKRSSLQHTSRLNLEVMENPRELALKIVNLLEKDNELKKIVSKIETAGPGFINFWLSEEYLILSMFRNIDKKINYPFYHLGTHKRVMVEFAHPNTHKPFHIGHLRNITLGESLVRILELLGNHVIRANYEGDVGMHIAKCLYGLAKGYGVKTSSNQLSNLKLDEKVKLLGDAYVAGNNAFENDEAARKEILQINKDIYLQKEEVYNLWKETRQWSLDYFDGIYKRVYSHYDRLFFESEVYKRGLEMAKEAVQKGILEESDGAIVFKGEQYNLHTRVFVTSEGNPTYEGKDLGLAELQTSLFGDIDKIIHVVDVQQSSYFETLFKVLELLDEKRYKDVQYHLPYGFVKLKEGKMSSRLGNVILGEWLLDEAKKRIKESNAEIADEVAEVVAVSAVKYSFLKVDARSEISFDFNQSISLEGNSGPYLQYTYARSQSVISKSAIPKKNLSIFRKIDKITQEELALLRTLYKFPEVVLEAGKTYSPNEIANFLYDLAQKYNLFYQKIPILNAETGEQKTLRLSLTSATAQVLKNGLHLLGIDVVEKM